MHHIIFTIIFTLLTTVSYSQGKTSYKEFLSLFNKTQLPYCTDFKDENISYKTDTLELDNDSILCTYEYVSSITNKNSDILIPEILIKEYLLQADESIFNLDLYSSGYDTTSKSIFVPQKLLISNQHYYGLTFTKYYSVGWQYNSEKYFCTLDKKGGNNF